MSLKELLTKLSPFTIESLLFHLHMCRNLVSRWGFKWVVVNVSMTHVWQILRQNHYFVLEYRAIYGCVDYYVLSIFIQFLHVFLYFSHKSNNSLKVIISRLDCKGFDYRTRMANWALKCPIIILIIARSFCSYNNIFIIIQHP